MQCFNKINNLVLVFIFIFLISALSGCVSERHATKPVSVVGEVDINRYQGKWYEIARFPHFFQRDCVGSAAEYKIIDAQNISVKNTCRIKTYYGKEKSIYGKAHIVEGSNGAKLRVRFSKFPANLFAGDYWITMLDKNYNWVVVTDSKGGYLWILSREQKMSEGLYDDIKHELIKRGFKTEFLNKH